MAARRPAERARWALLAALGVVAGLVVLDGAGFGRDRIWVMVAGPADLGPVDFATLQPGPYPNHFLVCPPAVCKAGVSHADAPVFAVPASRLMAAVDAVAAAEPRTRRVDDGTHPLGARYVVRSRVMHFPDTVSVDVVPLDDDRSTLAVYARSQLGSDDFGVNRRRIERWLAEIGARAGAAG
ncbi:DUF1499 domain-containing protein [Amorphus sp. MBR-141]